MTKYPDVEVQLSGLYGNAYAIMGRVADGIRRKYGALAANAYLKEAREQGSYDALIQHAMSTVVVK